MNSYVSPWMDPDLVFYRDTARRFLAAEVLPHAQRWRERGYIDRELWIKFGELGLMLPDVPEEYGGAGGTFAHLAVLLEELARLSDRGCCAVLSVHCIVAHYILNHGTEAQKNKYLPGMASGNVIGAIAMTEPGAGSDLQGVQTRADRIGDEYVINGSKTFISNGHHADLVVVVAKTDAQAGAKGISLFVVEAKQDPGYRIGRLLEKIGQKSADTTELFFDDLRVPTGRVLGGIEGRGFSQLMSDLPYERTVLAVIAAATIERALEITVEYARERKMFGGTLLQLQNTRFKLAEVKTQARIGRVFVDHCIARVIDGTMDTETASMGKLWLTEVEGKVVDECLQLFGGYGYMLEYPIAQMYADVRVERIFAGTSEIMKEIIARSL
ncbi:acyl-CoA dehydrogenase family protein [Paraburkholderia sp. D1E]|uniref:acyl-CoA dehydrogenase family protein n=1 Tax=Paraburkholderia sp. D1E TaxID=3461398 RepID=UPI00404560F9